MIEALMVSMCCCAATLILGMAKARHARHTPKPMARIYPFRAPLSRERLNLVMDQTDPWSRDFTRGAR